MSERRLIRIGLNGIACFLSFSLLGVGLYSLWGIDPRFNPLLSTLYYALPLASFPVFLVGLAWRRVAIVQVILALAYLPVCVMLGWRQCSSLGYCTTVAAVTFVNMQSRPVLAFLGTAIASVVVMVMRERSSPQAR
jgi:hypothetical protein